MCRGRRNYFRTVPAWGRLYIFNPKLIAGWGWGAYVFWPKLVFLAGVGSFRRVSVRCFDEFGGVFGVRGGRVVCGDGRVSLQGRVGRGEVLHDRC